jgi:hypothetical protein
MLERYGTYATEMLERCRSTSAARARPGLLGGGDRLPGRARGGRHAHRSAAAPHAHRLRRRRDRRDPRRGREAAAPVLGWDADAIVPRSTTRPACSRSGTASTSKPPTLRP